MKNTLAKRLRLEAIRQIGGPQAWARMAHDPKVDAIRCQAWIMVQNNHRADEGMVAVAMLMEAMRAVHDVPEGAL